MSQQFSANWQSINITETIDLQAADRPARNIGDDWVIEIQPKNSMFNFFKSHKKINCPVSVQITDLQVAPELVLDVEQPLLTIRCDGTADHIFAGRDHEGCGITLVDLKKSFTLQFVGSTIRDVKPGPNHSDKSSYPISFKLTLSLADGSVVDTSEVKIDVEVKEISITPVVGYRYKPEMRTVRYDSKRGTETVGQLEIHNPTGLEYAPDLNLDVTVEVKRNGQHLEINDFANPISLDLTSVRGVEVDETCPNGLKFKVSEFGRSRNLVIPIKLDYTKIPNPVTDPTGQTVLDLDVKVDYCNSNSTDVVRNLLYSFSEQLKVDKNDELPTLAVVLTDPNSNLNVDLTAVDAAGTEGKEGAAGAASNIVKLDEIRFQPGNGLRTPIPVTLCNRATEGAPGAGVYIENVKLRVRASDDTVLKLRRNNAAGVNSLFSLKGAKNRIKLPNTNSSTAIQIDFDGNDVAELYRDQGKTRNYNLSVLVDLTFDYYIDEKGYGEDVPETFFTAANCRKFSRRLRVPLYQMPNPEWLAVDFGTSAIVAQYADKMLNLHAVKDAMPRVAEARQDSYEKGTPFLSSNLVLRQVQASLIENLSQLVRDNNGAVGFDKQAVFLSPTSHEERAASDFALPCLKLIVGYDILPNISNYANYQYQYRHADGSIQRQGLYYHETDSVGDTYSEYTPLAQIDTIFGEVYAELLHYYVHPCIKQSIHRINRLVLTVPNTYTPRHLERIEGIVRASLSELNLREIKFVSESDAVACYYQRNWTDINRRLNRLDSTLDERENVLVYDIGAGTLDVTLFTKYFDASQNKTVIEVLGKIGIAKAGNYLDSLIALLLARKFPNLKNLADPAKITGASVHHGALELKSLIKNEIKPCLSQANTTYTFKKNLDLSFREEIAVDLKDVILNKPEFTGYIREITEDLLANFFDFFKIDSQLKIDTVLLSGRTAKLSAINSALRAALRQRSTDNLRIVPVSDLNDEGSMYDKCKTIVVEGAVDYVNLYADSNSHVRFVSPRLIAHYGVIYRDAAGADRYVDLLNPQDYKHVGAEAFDTKPVELNLSSVGEIKLVQTFSSDTAADWRTGNREYITEMAEIPLSTIRDKSSVKLSIHVDASTYLTLCINGQQLQGLTSSKIDINSKSNARSLWPTRLSNQETEH